ncbi:unnamed protein product [Lepidochelys olivacea]
MPWPYTRQHKGGSLRYLVTQTILRLCRLKLTVPGTGPRYLLGLSHKPEVLQVQESSQTSGKVLGKDQLAVCVRLLETCAPGSGALKDHLEAEVKNLGGNVALLLNGCECEITSMILKSKEQIEQSVVAVASWLGQLMVAVGLEANLE